MQEHWQHFIDNFLQYASGASVILTVVGVLFSLLTRTLAAWSADSVRKKVEVLVRNRPGVEVIVRNRPGASEKKDAITPSIKTPFQVARDRVQSRLRETEILRNEQLDTRKWSNRASVSLTFAQYIIGGVLASSFVQESLTPKWVGALGVLVLIASLFKQQFHPEVTAEDAKKKAFQLLTLRRSSEDQLAILDAKDAAGQNHTDAMTALLTQITQRLSEIENPENSRPS